MQQWCIEKYKQYNPLFFCLFKKLSAFRCNCVYSNIQLNHNINKRYNYSGHEFTEWHEKYGKIATEVKNGQEKDRLTFKNLVSYCTQKEQNLSTQCNIYYYDRFIAKCSCSNENSKRESSFFLYNYEDVLTDYDIFSIDIHNHIPPPPLSHQKTHSI